MIVSIAAIVALCMVMPSVAVFAPQEDGAWNDGAESYDYEPKGAPVADLFPTGIGMKGNGSSILDGDVSTEITVGPGSENNLIAGEYVFKEGGSIRVKEGYILYFDVVDITLEGNGDVFKFEKGSSVGITVGMTRILLKTFDEETDATLAGRGSFVLDGTEENLLHLDIPEGFEFRLGRFAVVASAKNTMDVVLKANFFGSSIKADFGGLSITYPFGGSTDTLAVSGKGEINAVVNSEGSKTSIGLKGELGIDISGGNFSASVDIVSDLLLAVLLDDMGGLVAPEGYSSGSLNIAAEVSAKIDLSTGGEDPAELKAALEKLRVALSLSGDPESKALAFSADVSFDSLLATVRSDEADATLEIRDFAIGFDSKMTMEALMGLSEVSNITLPDVTVPSKEMYDVIDAFLYSLGNLSDVKDVLDGFAADPVGGYVELSPIVSSSKEIYGFSGDVAKLIAILRGIEHVSVSLDVGSLDVEIEAKSENISLDAEAGGISADVSVSSGPGESSDVAVSKVTADAKVERFRLEFSNEDTSINKLEASAELSLEGEVITSVDLSDKVVVDRFAFKGGIGLSLYAKGYHVGDLFMMQVEGGKVGFDFNKEGMYVEIGAETLRIDLSGTKMLMSSFSVDTTGKLSVEEMRMNGPFLDKQSKFGMFTDCDICVKGLERSGFENAKSSVDRVDARIELVSGSTFELKSTWNSRTVSVNGGNVTSNDLTMTDLPFSKVILTQIGIVPEGATLTFEGDSLYVAGSFYKMEGGKVSGSFAFDEYFLDPVGRYSLQNEIVGGYVGVEYSGDGPSFSLVPEKGYTGTNVASPTGFTYDAGTKAMTIAPADTVTELKGLVEGLEKYHVYLDLGNGNVKGLPCDFKDTVNESIPVGSDGQMPLFVVNGFGKSVGSLTETSGSFSWSYDLDTAGDTNATVCYGNSVTVVVGDNTFDSNGLKFTIPSDASGNVRVKTASGVVWDIDGEANKGKTYSLLAQKTTYDGRDVYLVICYGGNATMYMPVDGSDSVLFHVNNVGLSSATESSFVDIDGTGYLKYGGNSYSYFYTGADPYYEPSEPSDPSEPSSGSGGGINVALVGAAVAVVAVGGLAGAYFLRGRFVRKP